MDKGRKNKMRRKSVMLFLSVLFALSACAKMPEEQSRGEEANEKIVEASDINEVKEIHYEGEYVACDTDEPMLQVRENEDGTYLIQVGIYRVVQLDNCIGIENGNRIDFTTTEWGEDKEINGTLTLDGDIATITLEASWSDTWFKDVSEYQYYKISDVPNIYEN